MRRRATHPRWTGARALPRALPRRALQPRGGVAHRARLSPLARRRPRERVDRAAAAGNHDHRPRHRDLRGPRPRYLRSHAPPRARRHARRGPLCQPRRSDLRVHAQSPVHIHAGDLDPRADGCEHICVAGAHAAMVAVDALFRVRPVQGAPRRLVEISGCPVDADPGPIHDRRRRVAGAHIATLGIPRAAALALGFELLAPVLLGVRRLRPIGIGIGVGLHVVVAITMYQLIYFSLQMFVRPHGSRPRSRPRSSLATDRDQPTPWHFGQ